MWLLTYSLVSHAYINTFAYFTQAVLILLVMIWVDFFVIKVFFAQQQNDVNKNLTTTATTIKCQHLVNPTNSERIKKQQQQQQQLRHRIKLLHSVLLLFIMWIWIFLVLATRAIRFCCVSSLFYLKRRFGLIF